MVQFRYHGVDSGGHAVSGSVDATDQSAAVVAMRERGHFATEVSQIDSGGQSATAVDKAEGRQSSDRLGEMSDDGAGGRLTGKDVLAMTEQLSTALRAGLPLMACLKAIHEQSHKASQKRLFGELEDAVSSGQSLSEAMSQRPRVFSPLYLAMIRVGETGGIMDQTTAQLAALLKRDEQVKTNMKNASAYPSFVLFVGFISALVVVTWILPNIVGTIAETGTQLPWPTQLLLGLSSFVKSWGWLVALAVVAVVVGMRQWVRSPEGRLKWDQLRLHTPVLGRVQRAIAVGRFARTLGALTKGGITILEALNVVRDTLGNEALAREIDAVAEKVRAGEPLAQPLKQSGLFPALLVQVVSVGEQTGKLDELLLNAAETFESEADSAIARFMAVFPAVLILFLALVIGFIVAATLLPIVVMEIGAGGM